MEYHGPSQRREGNSRMSESDPGLLSNPGSVPETARKASKGPSESLETACR